MKKRKCDWCYFDDGSKKKITNWYQFGDDILFFIDDKLYMYKKYRFGYEERYIITRKNLITPFLSEHEFYIHRFFTKDYPLICVNENDAEQWFIANIERIELRE